MNVLDFHSSFPDTTLEWKLQPSDGGSLDSLSSGGGGVPQLFYIVYLEWSSYFFLKICVPEDSRVS